MGMERLLPFGPKPGQPGGSGGVRYQIEKAKIEAELARQINLIKGGTVKGLILSAAFVRNQTENSYPKTPVDLGNLRASWFITTAKSKVANDKWNKGFRTSAVGTKRVASAEMQANHESTITQAQGELAAMTTGEREFVMMGYSANYGGYVHEFVGDVNWTRQDSGPKWLQDHVYRNTGKILQIVRDNAKVIG